MFLVILSDNSFYPFAAEKLLFRKLVFGLGNDSLTLLLLGNIYYFRFSERNSPHNQVVC